MTENSSSECVHCQAKLPDLASFCPKCGKKISARISRSVGPMQILLFIGVGVLVWSFGWFTQASLSGEKPTLQFAAMKGKQAQTYNDPSLDRLRAAVKASPDEITAWQALVGEIMQKMKQSPHNDPGLALEAIDALREILRLDPSDLNAIRMMAEVAFAQQAFDKAAEYYARYLESEPTDKVIQARYASSLTFIGRYDESIETLQALIESDPNYFQAKAYLAITYAQMGDLPKAAELGEQAITLAPTDEARARFSDFLRSVKQKGKDGTQAAASDQLLAPFPAGSTAREIAAFLLKHPITGPKVATLRLLEGGVLTVGMNDFPMDQMPEFAKQKFFSGIQEVYQSKPDPLLKTLAFIDNSSKQPLGSLPLEAKAR